MIFFFVKKTLATRMIEYSFFTLLLFIGLKLRLSRTVISFAKRRDLRADGIYRFFFGDF